MEEMISVGLAVVAEEEAEVQGGHIAGCLGSLRAKEPMATFGR